MAWASGCSEDCSADATSRSNSFSSMVPAVTMSVRAGSPRVMVPVLSNTMVSILCAVSSASAERMRIPCSAPLPVETMIDSGVASPRAQGQAMINTATAATNDRVSAGSGPTVNHTVKVTTAMNITAGTK